MGVWGRRAPNFRANVKPAHYGILLAAIADFQRFCTEIAFYFIAAIAELLRIVTKKHLFESSYSRPWEIII